MSNSNPICEECSKRHDVHNVCKMEDLATEFIPTPQRVQEMFIRGTLPGLNQYTDKNRAHWSKGAKMKKEVEEKVMWWIKFANIKPIKPAQFTFHYIEKKAKNGKQRDPDNIASCKKFIFDALQKMGIMKDDSMKYVLGWQETWEVSDKPGDAGVRIIIKEQ